MLKDLEITEETKNKLFDLHKTRSKIEMKNLDKLTSFYSNRKSTYSYHLSIQCIPRCEVSGFTYVKPISEKD